MDVVQFQEKLREICELGKQNRNMLTHEQIREHFAGTDLETSQMLKVLQYLKLQGIMIEGDTAPVETEEVGETEPESKGTSTPLTSEEEAYLKDYLAEVSNGKEVSPEMLHTLFENLADGDAIAEAALTSIYLPVAANMAADDRRLSFSPSRFRRISLICSSVCFSSWVSNSLDCLSISAERAFFFCSASFIMVSAVVSISDNLPIICSIFPLLFQVLSILHPF